MTFAFGVFLFFVLRFQTVRSCEDARKSSPPMPSNAAAEKFNELVPFYALSNGTAKLVNDFRIGPPADRLWRRHRRKNVYSDWSDWSPCSAEKCVTVRQRHCLRSKICGSNTITESSYCFTTTENGSRRCLGLAMNDNERSDSILSNKVPANDEHVNSACGANVDSTAAVVLAHKSPRRFMKIMGGRESRKSRWPWHAAVLNGYKVERVVVHPRYNPTTIDNDMALLKLGTLDLEVNGGGYYLQPACLPVFDFQRRKRKPTVCVVIGWGKERSQDSYGSLVLREAMVPIVGQRTCRAAYRRYAITDNMLCAGYRDGRADTCSGDSGGPLLCLMRGRWTVAGVTSFGDGCGRRGKYGVYANVANHVRWIVSVVSPEEREKKK